MQDFRRHLGLGGRRKQTETGRAGARHARQLAAGETAQRRKHVCDHRLQRDRRGFEIVRLGLQISVATARGSSNFAIAARSSGTGASAPGFHPANTSLVASATPGLISTAGKRRQRQRLGEFFADAAHQPRARIEAHRHVGAGRARRFVEPRIVGRQSVRPHDQAERRRRVGRSAAEPRRDRQVLFEMERAQGDAGNARGKRARRLEHEIVGIGAGLRRASRR